jgi:polysaccharide biosynthesis protein PslH
MKKLLFLCQYVPYPPDSGGKIKAYYLLQYLSSLYDLVLVHYYRDDKELQALSKIRHLFASIYSVHLERSSKKDFFWYLKSIIIRIPFFILRDSSKDMERAIGEALATDDIAFIHIDQLNMAQFVLNYDIPKILDTQNVVSKLLERMYLQEKSLLRFFIFLDWKKMRAYEGRACLACDRVVAVSEYDARELEHLMMGKKLVDIIPIGIDTNDFPLLDRNRQNKHIIFIGTMFYPPNNQGVLWFLENVWPQIKEKHPDVHFKIIGKGTTDEIKVIADKDFRVEILGSIEDLQGYLSEVCVWVVPIKAGSGMRLKILTALSYGIPVVTTKIGSEGINIQHNRHVILADAPEDFAEAIHKLLIDKKYGESLSKSGRDFVVNNYDYKKLYKRWNKIYSGVITGYPRE